MMEGKIYNKDRIVLFDRLVRSSRISIYLDVEMDRYETEKSDWLTEPENEGRRGRGTGHRRSFTCVSVCASAAAYPHAHTHTHTPCPPAGAQGIYSSVRTDRADRACCYRPYSISIGYIGARILSSSYDDSVYRDFFSSLIWVKPCVYVYVYVCVCLYVNRHFPVNDLLTNVVLFISSSSFPSVRYLNEVKGFDNLWVMELLYSSRVIA